VAERQRLLEVLERARDVGLLGPGPVDAHVEHAVAWAAALAPDPGSFLDLGAGAGVPGLVLLLVWPQARGTFLDSRRRSVETIAAAAAELGWADRVTVIEGRAEELGRERGLRESFPLVVARGFGTPPETAECGSAFVRIGGRLSVSEPPGGGAADRWSEGGLAEVGLRMSDLVTDPDGSFAVLEKVGPLAERFPRRVGQPRRRPLW
jgi:16S rRNA (guanine527-N7)-methyltransferase